MRIRSLLFAILMVMAPRPSACSLIPCVERRHESGVLLVCAEQIRDTSEELKAAAAFGWDLAEQYPDDFAYPLSAVVAAR